jgi:ATP-dependent Lon protease
MSNNGGNNSEMSDSDYDETVSISKLKKMLQNKKFMYLLYPSTHLQNSIEKLERIINKIDEDTIDNHNENKKILDDICENNDSQEDSIMSNSSNSSDSSNSIDSFSDTDGTNDSDDIDDTDNANDPQKYINIILSINPANLTKYNKNTVLSEQDDTPIDNEIIDDDSDSEYKPTDEEFIGKKRSYNTRNSKNTMENKNINTLTPKRQKIDVEDKKLIEEFEKKRIEKQKQYEKKKNVTEYKKLIQDSKNLNDLKYFQELENNKQTDIIKMLKEIKQYETIDKPYRILLLQKDLESKHKSIAMRKINTLMNSPPGFGEYNKIKKWVDGFMNIPFGKYNKINMSLSNGIDKCTDFMLRAKSILDQTVYGLNDAKTQILQLIAQIITNPSATGTAIAIKGPMGTGKTTLVKEGISKILNRPFAFLPLGGATDSSYLEGHSYTYEGSCWGKIVDILMSSGSMSPLIYFDELDKVSRTSKGEEIIGILTHLTDTTQNTGFHDKYFSEIEFDLSRALYIFSYNEEHLVNPILKDRMYCIETNGYNTKEKIVIAREYLIPSIMKNVGFNTFLNKVIFDDTVLEHIINTYTKKEKGVRNLKRCIEIIFTKLNLYRIMKPGTILFDKKQTVFEVKFPYTVSRETCDLLLKKDVQRDMSYMMLYS